MHEPCANIYAKYRKAAGITQERAAGLLGCSVRALANWESGVNTPPDSIVVTMADVYAAQTIAIEHLRSTTQIAREVLPAVRVVPMSQAVCSLVSAIKEFVSGDCDWALLDIASDGVVDELEEKEFQRLMEQLDRIVEAALLLKYSNRGRQGGECRNG